ncbi:MAG: hypothetical protein AAFY88_28060 [Acidobacteriota bacterium]
MIKIASCAALGFAAMLASAPVSAADDTCLYAGEAYSPSVYIRAGQVTFKCEVPEGSKRAQWVEVKGVAQGNCFYAGELYGDWAVVQAGAEYIRCQNGDWVHQVPD